MKSFSLIFLVLILCNEAFAKKDFRGLFGSYRREKFTENPGEDSEYGFDLMMSTLFPLNDMVKSDETGGGTFAPLNYSVFYNVEFSAWMSFHYNWVGFLNFGWYNYESRKENSITKDNLNNATTPIFHQFELVSYPVVAGVRYRFSREDIVPYVGLGVGYAFTRRKGSYDNDTSGTLYDEKTEGIVVGQGTAGVEFYFASNAGLRIEVSGYYFSLPSRVYDTGGSPAQKPILQYQANPWSVRYSSGVFMAF